MGNGSHIDTVQGFVELIGDNDKLWKLLHKRKLSRLKEQVKYNDPKQNIAGVKYYTQGIVYAVHELETSEVTIEIKYIDGFIFRYKKEQFIRKFNKISPPLSCKEISELVRRDKEARDIQIWQTEKQTLLEKLKVQFDKKFLNVDNFYEAQCTEYISFKEYQSEKLNYVQSWVQRHLNSSPDFEQAAAIGAVECHIQVVARAGSGKTSTLVNRALFLQKHCEVASDEMLLLAFNRKAADEIRERFTLQLKGYIPHVMTFHALAYALVHPEESILFNEPDAGQNKSRVLQNVIDNHLRDPIFYEKIRALMMAHFREDWERILSGGYDKSPEEMLRYRRSLPKEGIDGTYFKSFGEKLIGDFLFEHDIKYKYEQNFWWDGINYRPDFTIITGDNQGVVIEYFGLEGDPDYDKMSDAKREYWRNNPTCNFVELSPRTLKFEGAEDFCLLLKRCLESYDIKCDRLSEEAIWKKIKVRAIDRFTKVVEGFIQRCRKLCLTSEILAKIIDNHDCASNIEQKFLEIAQIFYQSYLNRLQETGEEDFDGLMQQAAALVKSGQTIFKRKSCSGDLKSLRYVLIDEYQDFSLLFHHLIEAIREQNPQAKFFCVGDDWQAINGFAGSDLRFYQNFAQFFQPSQKLHISTNYRSAASIVDIGNRLMQGLGNPARAHTSIFGIVEIADIRQFNPTLKEQQKHSGDIIIPAILRLVDHTIKDGKQVVLLSRKNSLPWYVNYGKHQDNLKNGSLESFLNLVRSYLPKNLREAVTISTAHKYKGLQKDVVIILDAVPRSYPLIHPDLMFTRVFGDSIELVIDEERRLFYVALTRAVERLFIVTESNNLSPFLDELKANKKINLLDWLDYPPCNLTIPQITIKVGNQSGRGTKPTIAIKRMLKAEGYNWKRTDKAWCRTYPAQEFSIQQYFDKAEWISHATGIEVQFYDDLENIIAKYYLEQGQCTAIINHIPDVAAFYPKI
ncbi:UvrD-helicase domain-containing protein [Tolypothrix sp. FACHB-123]|uniref:UvrD-helicase domain-containing protein n=1 Tax=Tolypothrix sp. FACHB-123 TaxID=2692868 RepID=UPI001685F4DC|nr:UvrD-helicase domain-containing protein [Tolypothrix sp. FACHB-123]MBD2354465.1 UvrD-helicase domain-containing protein [Tolypothrix sp. FACHB-123]